MPDLANELIVIYPVLYDNLDIIARNRILKNIDDAIETRIFTWTDAQLIWKADVAVRIEICDIAMDVCEKILIPVACSTA
jgi:hypothetical protein